MKLRVLTVCAGNICRSPAAAAAIRDESATRGIDVEVDSAGTGAWNIGEPPHPQSVAAGKRVGLDITGRARRINSKDFVRFDMIVVMDHSNLRDVLAMKPSLAAQAKIRLFRTYDPASEANEIPDPYGQPDETYDEMISLVKASTVGMLDSLVSAGVEDSITLE